MKIANSFSDLVGNTPLLRMERLAREYGVPAALLAKLECFNPAGSVKDRVAEAMIEDAQRRGLLREGSVIVEPTSGNTGIGLAAAAAIRGYRVILTMPDTIERRAAQPAAGLWRRAGAHGRGQGYERRH